MIVLGIDPGATIGLALLDVPDTWRRGAPSRAGKARVVAVGAVRAVGGSALRPVYDWLDAARAKILPGAPTGLPRLDVVGIERPMGYAYQAARVGPLLDAAWQGGEFAGWATHAGIATMVAAVPAGDWRRLVVGTPSARDAQVAAALGSWVVGLGRSNAHGRDAIGVAIGAALLPVCEG